MDGRLAGKTAVVVGAGQTPGETTGNGRAVAVRFAREGARVMVVDRDGTAELLEEPRRLRSNFINGLKEMKVRLP